MADLRNLGIAVRLRRWQTHAVQQIVDRIEKGERNICLVAPPGSGKTICSLAVAVELGRFIEVRVPTTALVTQWKLRIEQFVVSLLPEGKQNMVFPFRVATYASNTPFHKDALLLLDEAHHLTSTWGDWVEAQEDGSQIRFGLTATPPLGSKDWNRFVALFGSEPVEIPAPPLVRDGQLSPFLDLVWPVLVDVDDLPLLQQTTNALQILELQLGVEYRAWQDELLREKIWELTEDYFSEKKGLLVALCRLQHTMGRDLPADIYPDEELLALPTLHDRAYALWAFAQEKGRKEVDPLLREAGFRIRKSGPVLIADVAWKSLSGSVARVRGAIELLALEHKIRGDDLRALIVCDRDVEGDVLSARQVLKALVSNPETDKLDPILVSGAIFWIDDDLWERIQPRLPSMSWVQKDGHHELSVEGWTTGERVAFATQLLSEGITRCLVGTRHLLGEGWDCPAVSCVIDLTGISAFVTVNQIRGRALRPNPADPSKIASLWDVISLAPGISDGDRMLKQLVQRHEHTFGIDEQGVIRSGVARIDPILTHSLEQVSSQVPRLQQQMAKKLEEVDFCAEKWSVGQAYLDSRVWKVTLPSREMRSRAQLPEESIPSIAHPAQASSLFRQKRLQRKKMILSILGNAVFWGSFSAMLLDINLYIGVAMGVFLGSVGALLLQKKFVFEEKELAVIVQVLYEAMTEQDIDLGALHSHQGRFWVDSTDEGERFARALATLLGQIRYPRYLLVDQLGRVFAIPEELSIRRDTADRFAEHWAKHVCACTAVYARSKKGKLFLHRVWQLGRLDSIDVMEAWE